MQAAFLDSLSLIPSYFAYLIASFLVTWLFVAIYIRLTPYREVHLIRSGNLSAALSLGGAMLGFVISLAGVIIHSVSLVDLAIWGGVALIVQLAAFFLVRWVIPELVTGIERGDLAHGSILGLASLAAGILSAACMVP
ncbi:MAG: DUF350 domain-containing protein [Pseudomonadota bacterium]